MTGLFRVSRKTPHRQRPPTKSAGVGGEMQVKRHFIE
jgi:hypothetical protein